MKLLLRFLFSLSLIFFGNASPLDAQQRQDESRHVWVSLPERIDNTRVFTIVDLPLTELRTVLSASPRAHEEIVTSDNETEDDEDEEEFHSLKKVVDCANYFTSFLSIPQRQSFADHFKSPLHGETLAVNLSAPSVHILFQVFRI